MSSGYGAYRPAALAISQKSAAARNEKRMNGKWQLCWRCQKDRPLHGGSVQMLGGRVPGTVRKFICADCLKSKQAKSEGGAA